MKLISSPVSPLPPFCVTVGQYDDQDCENDDVRVEEDAQRMLVTGMRQFPYQASSAPRESHRWVRQTLAGRHTSLTQPLSPHHDEEEAEEEVNAKTGDGDF